MRSYIKIYGPPIVKAIKTLEMIGVNMPEVCIWNTTLETMMTVPMTEAEEASYFSWIEELPEKRCGKIISKSGEKTGEYDFYFEWFKNPNNEELNKLIEKIDERLAPLGCKYTITTK